MRESGDKSGRVFLVGAGPGDPGLLTLRGRECLEMADVVLYDRLVDARILNFARAGAEKICVGKMEGHKAYDQEAINKILIARAKGGMCVVRIKGGDPFLFGRGGEEAMALAAEGIAFEVVPGVTSALAVPAYAGIPVTHRGLSGSVHIFNAHPRAADDSSDIDWEAVVRLSGTLVFLMGAKQLGAITEQLLAHGMKLQMPIALTQWGSWDQQKTLLSTLGEIVREPRVEEFSSPLVIVVGEVAALHRTIGWFESTHA